MGTMEVGGCGMKRRMRRSGAVLAVGLIACAAAALPARAEEDAEVFRGVVSSVLEHGESTVIGVSHPGEGVTWVLAPRMDVRVGQGLEIDDAALYRSARNAAAGLTFDRLVVPTHGVLQGQEIKIADSRRLPAGWTAADAARR